MPGLVQKIVIYTGMAIGLLSSSATST